MGSRRHRLPEDDPLTRALAPPCNETPRQREHRLRAEQEAKRVSDAIDDELNRQRIADKKSPKPIKILLLGACVSLLSSLPLNQPGRWGCTGQSESGEHRARLPLSMIPPDHPFLALTQASPQPSRVSLPHSSLFQSLNIPPFGHFS